VKERSPVATLKFPNDFGSEDRMTAVCEDYYHLDLAWLQRRRILTPGRKSVVTWSSWAHRVIASSDSD